MQPLSKESFPFTALILLAKGQWEGKVTLERNVSYSEHFVWERIHEALWRSYKTNVNRSASQGECPLSSFMKGGSHTYRLPGALGSGKCFFKRKRKTSQTSMKRFPWARIFEEPFRLYNLASESIPGIHLNTDIFPFTKPSTLPHPPLAL